ncbi:peptidoglycan bridge formation glycyltransferase FemA/FemB family protein [Maribacter halichondriae]|uniref:peptidoglycan bridge formation glycyltransferase FemA/FemB family protein n=1 Tax=Maribacter halichondriae TaxID=2980554 RepID=UPI002359C3BC|nr:peptidoglycan bridge formation glycyltransferase FemA/FemB family protein [Maribacter sp. Hal144]
MVNVITEGNLWKAQIARFESYDFYHTYDYHIISKKENEAPVLLVYKEDDKLIALPLLKRPIEGTEFFDFTSVYGYPGPLTKGLEEGFDNKNFVQALSEKFAELKIVSVFSRLHPYIKLQESVLNGLGETPTIGKVVNIDLTQDVDVQRAQYGKSTKNRTNKCRRLCTVKKAKNVEDIDTFIDIYYENMDRLSATKDYYFSREYFHNFLQCDDFDTDILLVVHNEDKLAVAASMFVKTKNIIQFHLSGSKTDYLDIAPANLFLDEMRLRATEEGYEIFNLGGGLGGREDSLFNFKASFSKDHRDFKVWKYIVDQRIYAELSKNIAGKYESAFFPLYRK